MGSQNDEPFIRCENRFNELFNHVQHTSRNIVDWYSFAREVGPIIYRDRLLTFWAAFTNLLISQYWKVQNTWNFRHWKLDLISFLKCPHGPPKLHGIESYECFFLESGRLSASVFSRSGHPSMLLFRRSHFVAPCLRSFGRVPSTSSCVNLSNIKIEH